MQNLRLAILVTALSASACGSGSSSSSGGYVTFAGNVNADKVLDSSGNTFHFNSSDGCMYSTVSGVGPEGFCLTSSGGTLQSYGPTNCQSPASNSACNTPNFGVALTANPTGPGCIAVLTNGAAGQATGADGLSVASSGTGFSIIAQTYANRPSAYATYWNSVVPVCGGSNVYAGTYALTTTKTSGGASFNSPQIPASFLIDSGGQIVANGQLSGNQLVGSLYGTVPDGGISGATFGNSFYVSSSCGPCEQYVYTVNGAVQDGGVWTLSGTVSATASLNPGSDGAGTFTAVQQ